MARAIKQQVFSYSLMNKSVRTYPIVYKGRRVWIIDVSEDTNEEFGLGHQLVLWDDTMSLAMGWADRKEDGSYEGVTHYGMHELSFSGADLRELAHYGLATHKWTMAN